MHISSRGACTASPVCVSGTWEPLPLLGCLGGERDTPSHAFLLSEGLSRAHCARLRIPVLGGRVLGSWVAVGRAWERTLVQDTEV